MLGDFSHLCQLLLQLYTSMKSQTCLWLKKSAPVGFLCSKCSILSLVCTLFQSESLPVGGMERAKRKRGIKSPEKGSRRRRHLCSVLSSLQVVHQVSLLLSTSDNWYPGKRQVWNKVEPKLVSKKIKGYYRYLGQIPYLFSLITDSPWLLPSRGFGGITGNVLGNLGQRRSQLLQSPFHTRAWRACPKEERDRPRNSKFTGMSTTSRSLGCSRFLLWESQALRNTEMDTKKTLKAKPSEVPSGNKPHHSGWRNPCAQTNHCSG